MIYGVSDGDIKTNSFMLSEDNTVGIEVLGIFNKSLFDSFFSSLLSLSLSLLFSFWIDF